MVKTGAKTANHDPMLPIDQRPCKSLSDNCNEIGECTDTGGPRTGRKGMSIDLRLFWIPVQIELNDKICQFDRAQHMQPSAGPREAHRSTAFGFESRPGRNRACHAAAIAESLMFQRKTLRRPVRTRGPERRILYIGSPVAFICESDPVLNLSHLKIGKERRNLVGVTLELFSLELELRKTGASTGFCRGV
jgi:hypothetical protein